MHKPRRTSLAVTALDRIGLRDCSVGARETRRPTRQKRRSTVIGCAFCSPVPMRLAVCRNPPETASCPWHASGLGSAGANGQVDCDFQAKYDGGVSLRVVGAAFSQLSHLSTVAVLSLTTSTMATGATEDDDRPDSAAASIPIASTRYPCCRVPFYA